MYMLQIPVLRILSHYSRALPVSDHMNILRERDYYWGADKSLVRPGGKQTAPVKSVMARGGD